jgi:hypothetical protein
MSFLERLVDQSSLTSRQFESLASYLRVASGEIKLREAASLVSSGRTRGRPDRVVSIGSYCRTVSQARANIKKSLMTVVVGIWLGAIKPEDASRLFGLVGGGARELSEEDADRFLPLLEALLRRIVV